MSYLDRERRTQPQIARVNTIRPRIEELRDIGLSYVSGPPMKPEAEIRTSSQTKIVARTEGWEVRSPNVVNSLSSERIRRELEGSRDRIRRLRARR